MQNKNAFKFDGVLQKRGTCKPCISLARIHPPRRGVHLDASCLALKPRALGCVIRPTFHAFFHLHAPYTFHYTWLIPVCARVCVCVPGQSNPW